MFSFRESYFRLVGLFDWGYTRTQFFLSVSWNRYVFILVGYRNEKFATDPARIFGAIWNFCVKGKPIYLRNGARYSDFDEIFDPQVICIVFWLLFPKVVFPPYFAAILNFSIKCKNTFISETVRDRAISLKLEFLRKMQKKKKKKNQTKLHIHLRNLAFGHKWKSILKQEDGCFYKIINTHWDALFLLCKNKVYFSCEAIL